MINKQEIVGLPNLNRNIDILFDACRGLRVLVLTSASNKISTHNLKLQNFFDVIISDGIDPLSCIDPDVIMYRGAEFQTGDREELDQILNYKQALVCLNYSAVEELKKIKARPQNYILGYTPVDRAYSIDWAAHPEIDWWFLKDDVLYRNNLEKPEQDLITYTTTLDKYRVPINLKSGGRKRLMERWGSK
jgi:hypothetical protein